LPTICGDRPSTAAAAAAAAAAAKELASTAFTNTSISVSRSAIHHFWFRKTRPFYS